MAIQHAPPEDIDMLRKKIGIDNSTEELDGGVDRASRSANASVFEPVANDVKDDKIGVNLTHKQRHFLEIKRLRMERKRKDRERDLKLTEMGQQLDRFGELLDTIRIGDDE